MARNIGIGSSNKTRPNGFTLLELMIVISIVGILATMAVPTYQASVIKAKEAALRQDLFTLRDVLDQHRADQGKYPLTLQMLVSAGYLRAVPKDPFTNSEGTWQEMTSASEEGIIDVFSGADYIGTNGTPYNRW
ncbi:General secretion pathway protein G [Nitrospira sp. KM1]|uniref:prepilin-type N-terminal cleavage/methylation domain-containing protein n=1 Tax=Nitrospira sp. KM1 TaxID=1936990 RepID=UPI0013A7446E|nr:prepilin-type N-terminal cleavage/methylation domain-containing protein [Nitrospira sp. KM1]BCA54075.1 General secretion pathway protein G [Nitrospira sp. KM1]